MCIITYHGPYDYAEDLADIYSAIDLVWSQDLWQSGNNSDWLLPNRIYEASWAGCPNLAVAQTETGRRVVEDGRGWGIERPDTDLLIDLLGQLDRHDIAAKGQALLDRPADDFVQCPNELADLLERVKEDRA